MINLVQCRPSWISDYLQNHKYSRTYNVASRPVSVTWLLSEICQLEPELVFGKHLGFSPTAKAWTIKMIVKFLLGSTYFDCFRFKSVIFTDNNRWAVKYNILYTSYIYCLVIYSTMIYYNRKITYISPIDTHSKLQTKKILNPQKWSWLYGSWIYNYLCNQCLSPLKLWVWTLFMARCTRYNIMW